MIYAMIKSKWGGRREGAGAKRNPRSGVSHLQREDPEGRPLHVTVKLRRGLPRLRNKKAYRLLRDAFVKGCDRFGFRLCQYSVQNNHLHLIVEGEDRVAISRGMQGLLVRIAKGLNRVWGRRGKVFADRYHGRVLKDDLQLRRALAYVLNNARRHGLKLKWPVDLFSSAPWFAGWTTHRSYDHLVADVPIPIADPLPRSHWKAWTLYSRIRPGEVPGPKD